MRGTGSHMPQTEEHWEQQALAQCLAKSPSYCWPPWRYAAHNHYPAVPHNKTHFCRVSVNYALPCPLPLKMRMQSPDDFCGFPCPSHPHRCHRLHYHPGWSAWYEDASASFPYGHLPDLTPSATHPTPPSHLPNFLNPQRLPSSKHHKRQSQKVLLSPILWSPSISYIKC